MWGTTRIDSLISGIVSDVGTSDVYSIARQYGVTLFDAIGLIACTKFLPTIWRYTRNSFFTPLEGSLSRLNISTIPIYIIHSPKHPVSLDYWVALLCDVVEKMLGILVKGLKIAVHQVMYTHWITIARVIEKWRYNVEI